MVSEGRENTQKVEQTEKLSKKLGNTSHTQQQQTPPNQPIGWFRPPVLPFYLHFGPTAFNFMIADDQ